MTKYPTASAIRQSATPTIVLENTPFCVVHWPIVDNCLNITIDKRHSTQPIDGVHKLLAISKTGLLVILHYSSSLDIIFVTGKIIRQFVIMVHQKAKWLPYRQNPSALHISIFQLLITFVNVENTILCEKYTS